MRAHFWLILIVLLGAKVTSAQTPVPVEKEPHHHVELKNEFVEVIKVVLPAGESTLFHTHSRDRVAVDLTSTMLALQKWNEPEEQPERSIPGDISARANADAPYTHRLRNAGPTTYEVIDVEFLHRPEHPSEKAAASVVAENPSCRVYKWNLAAAGAATAHSHEMPYAILALTNLRLKTTAPDGTSTINDLKSGDVQWVNSKAVHTLTNAGSSDGQIVEIEMK